MAAKVKPLKIKTPRAVKAPKNPAKPPSFERGYLNELNHATMKQAKVESQTRKSLSKFSTQLKKR